MVDVWYCEAVEKIRFTADPGGESLCIEEAKQRKAELQRAITQAEASNNDETVVSVNVED